MTIAEARALSFEQASDLLEKFHKLRSRMIRKYEKMDAEEIDGVYWEDYAADLAAAEFGGWDVLQAIEEG